MCQFLSRWEDGPALKEVQPVVLEFHDTKDKMEVYKILISGLENSGCVVTEDSRFSLNYLPIVDLDLIFQFQVPSLRRNTKICLQQA